MSNVLVVNNPQMPLPITIVGGSGGATPGGATTQVQFNDAGAFGGDAGLTYAKATKLLTVGGQIKTATAFGGIVFDAAASDGILNLSVGNHDFGVFIGGGVVMDFQGSFSVITIASTYSLGWTAAGGNSAADVAFHRNAAGVIEINNGTTGTFADMKLRNLLVQSGGKATGAGTVPPGGTTGQILKKLSNADYDVGWVT